MQFDDTDQHGNTGRRRCEAVLPPPPTATTLRTRHGRRQLTLDFVVHPGFEGTVLNQIDQTTAYLGSSPSLAIASSKDNLGRVDRPAYSMRAVQEAVVNAVAHRDYALVGAQVRVQIFPDRIEVTSPGRLPNSLVPDDLYAGAQPLRRNQLLVGFLTHMPGPWSGRVFMESMGEGFLTMVRESEDLSGRRPELRLQTEAVTVIIFAAIARTA
jgi:predicted HTH transcriptional regulator